MKFEQLIQKIQEKVKIPNIRKDLFLNCFGGSTYPFLKSCEGRQYIWLSKKEFIEIRYNNVERYEKLLINNINKNRDEEEIILQNLNEENLTSLEIIFKKSQITEVIRILFDLLTETNAENYKIEIKYNEENLGVHTYKNILDKDEILIERYNIVVNQEKLIKNIKNNLKEKNNIKIFVEGLYTYTEISEKNIWFESYYHDDGYLDKLETERTDKIKSKNSV